jgi:hypothetical protein
MHAELQLRMRSGYRGGFGIVDADPTCCDNARLATTEPIGPTSSFSRDRLHSPSSELNDPAIRATSGTLQGRTPCSWVSALTKVATSRSRRDAMPRGHGARRAAGRASTGARLQPRGQNWLRTLQWHRHQQRQQQRQQLLQHQLHPYGCCRPNVIPRNV